MDAKAWRTQVLDEYEKNYLPPYADVALITDYLASNPWKDYTNQTYQDVSIKAASWYNSLKINTRPGISWTVHQFQDNFSIKWLLDRQSKKYESSFLRHCAYSDYKNSFNLYSLRDDKNRPLVTLMISQGVILQVKGFRNTVPSKKEIHQYLLPFLRKKNYKFSFSVVDFLGGGVISKRELAKMKTNYENNLYLMDDSYKDKLYKDYFAFFSDKDLEIAEGERNLISSDLINFVDEEQLLYFYHRGDSVAKSKALKQLVEKYKSQNRELPTEIAVAAIIEGLGQVKGFSVAELILQLGRLEVYFELLKRGRLDCRRYKLFEELVNRMYSKPAQSHVVNEIFKKLPVGALESMISFVNFNHKRILNAQPEFFERVIRFPEIVIALSFNKDDLSLDGENVETNLGLLLSLNPLFFGKKELYHFLNKNLSHSIRDSLEKSLKMQLQCE